MSRTFTSWPIGSFDYVVLIIRFFCVCVPRFQFFLYYVCDGFHTWWNWFAMLLFPGKQTYSNICLQKIIARTIKILEHAIISTDLALYFQWVHSSLYGFCRWVCDRVHALVAFLWSSLTGKEENMRSWCIQNQSIGVWTATENCYEQWWWQRGDVAAITKPWEIQQQVSWYPKNAHSYRQTMHQMHKWAA